MQLEILVKSPDFHKDIGLSESAINKLLKIAPHKPNAASRHLTNSQNITSARTSSAEFGKYIYAVFYKVTNPQEAYRNLSKEGFVLVDSKIAL